MTRATYLKQSFLLETPHFTRGIFRLYVHWFE